MPPLSLSLFSLLATVVGQVPAEPPSAPSSPTPAATSQPTAPVATPARALERQPVVLELFTSEGCSSCPPADELLGRIAAASTEQRPVIVLAFHVDYWDRLGWKDIYATSAFTDRQRQYAKAMGGDGLYTPQLVVGGTTDAVGSDAGKIKTLVDHATKAAPAKTSIELTIAPAKQKGENSKPAADSSVSVHSVVKDPPAGSVVNFAVTQTEVTSKIERGENGGRTLEHSHVVRSFITVTPAKDGSADAEITLPAGVERTDLRVVAYVQDAKTMKIVAAREISVPPATPLSTNEPAAKKP